jgi:FkbM family methyltransferase
MLTSYAQNFEDVILWRALGKLGRGFYIDIGAQDPVIDSVSLCFYEVGWRGIHVEPSFHYAALLRAARPDEVVIEAAVGSIRGIITFYEFATTGLSTCDPGLAQQHIAEGLEVRKTQVPAITLSDVLNECGEQEIHWLKIDVEGFEKQVIDGWLPATVRPWIIVVESTRPNSPEQTFGVWELQLVNLGYRYVYFDGLNRFYLSEAHLDLAHLFGPGPNVFDRFELSGGSGFAAGLGRKIAKYQEHERDLLAQIASFTNEVARLQEEYRQSTRTAADAQDRVAAAQEALADAKQLHEIQARNLETRLAASARARVETRLKYDQQIASLRHSYDRQIASLRQQLRVDDRRNYDTLRHLEQRVAELKSTANRATRVVADLKLDLTDMRNSLSWRITGPLRWVHSKTLARRAPTAPRGELTPRQSVADVHSPPAVSMHAPGVSPNIALPHSAALIYTQLKVARDG